MKRFEQRKDLDKEHIKEPKHKIKLLQWGGWSSCCFFLRPSSRLRRSGRAYVLLLCVCIADDMQNPSNTPSYKLDIPKIFSRYPQVIPKLSPRYPKDILKISPRYAKDMPKICRRYGQDMSELCPSYARVMPKICQRYARVMPELCPSYE